MYVRGSCLAIRLKDDKRRYDVLLLCNNIFSSSSSALIWQNANGRRFQKSHCSLVANYFSQFNGFLGLVFFLSGNCPYILWGVFFCVCVLVVCIYARLPPFCVGYINHNQTTCYVHHNCSSIVVCPIKNRWLIYPAIAHENMKL